MDGNKCDSIKTVRSNEVTIPDRDKEGWMKQKDIK